MAAGYYAGCDGLMTGMLQFDDATHVERRRSTDRAERRIIVFSQWA